MSDAGESGRTSAATRGVFILMIALSTTAAPMPQSTIAAARRQQIVETIHDVRVADPYRWLEDAADPAVKAWVARQNAASGTYLDTLRYRGPLRAWFKSILAATPAYDTSLRVAGGRKFVLTYVPGKQQPLLGTVTFTGDAIERRTIVDLNLLSETGNIAIDWFEPSPDGRLVAVSLSAGGSEDGTLHVYEVDGGREVEPPIPHVYFATAGGSLGWAPDSKGYWYTRYPDDGPDAERRFNQTAWFHRVGQPGAADTLVLGKDEGLPRTAEIMLSGASHDGRALASVQLGDGGQWQHFVLTSTAARKVASYEDRIVAATVAQDGRLYGISRRDAPNGVIVALDSEDAAGRWRTLVPEGPAALDSSANTHALVVAGDRLYATAIEGGPTRLLVFALDGRPRPVLTPPVSSIGALEPDGSGGIFYQQVGYTSPARTMHLDGSGSDAQATPLRVQSPLSFSDIEVRRVSATSRDGTRVPMTVMMKRGTRPGGRNRTLLYGYGGFGISMTPAFMNEQQRAWFDAGGIYAVANIRGGSELGEAWHQQGMLAQKQNGFDDFHACARWLIGNGWTSSATLALQGGSNGGLLIGAMITQHPGLARAVVSEVGIYDMIRLERDPNGSFVSAEYGSTGDKEQFGTLLAYSPYHHVVAGARYPAVLLTTGDNDGRVNPMHSRKFAAALQHATASGRPIYLRTSANTGHGFGTALDELVAQEADQSAFLFDQLGMSWTPPER